jgi:transposase
MVPPRPAWQEELDRTRYERDQAVRQLADMRQTLHELTQMMGRTNEHLEQMAAMLRRREEQVQRMEREIRKLRKELGKDDPDPEGTSQPVPHPEPGTVTPRTPADPNVCAPDHGTKAAAIDSPTEDVCPVEAGLPRCTRPRARSTGGRRPPPAHLPTSPEHHKACTCHACGHRTLKRDVLETAVYSVVATHVRRRLIRRERTLCTNPDCGRPTTAPMPPMPCPRALYDCKFLAWLVVQKFVLLVPLDRTRELLATQGVHLAMGTLVHLVELAAKLLDAIDGEHMRQLKASPYLCFDGTGLKTLVLGQCKAWDAYLEVFTHGEISVFQFSMTKHADGLEERLKGFEGVLVCDAESRNQAGSPGVVSAFCNAHVVRALKKAESAQPVLAKEGRRILDELYAIEDEATKAGVTGKARATLRQARAGPVLGRWRAWLTEVVEGELPPSDPVRKVAAYYLRHWDNLTRYIDDGDLPIDNNQAEREFQRHAKLRYASLFAGSPEGGHRWATIFGVVRTTQKCGLDVQEYLTWVFERRGTHRHKFGLPASALTPVAYREQLEQLALAAG